MPDLANFSVTRTTPLTINNAPRWIISGQITNSKTGAVIRDFTGANAVTFPQILGNFSQAKQDELVNQWVLELLRAQFPGEMG